MGKIDKLGGKYATEKQQHQFLITVKHEQMLFFIHLIMPHILRFSLLFR